MSFFCHEVNYQLYKLSIKFYLCVMKNIFYLFSIILLFACGETEKPQIEEKPTIINSAEGAVSKTARLDSLINIEPNNSKLYYQRARIYFDLGSFPRALIDVLSSIKLNKKSIVSYLLAGDIYIALGQGEDAVDLMSEAINNNPNNEALYTRAIEYNFLMKNEQAAINFANDLLRINKNNPDAYFFKGLIYKQTDKDKAISNFQTCVEQDPTYYNAYMQLGTLFSEKNDDLAIKYLDNALRLEPESREALYAKGFHYQQKEQFDKAKNEYKSMIIMNRRDFQALYNIGHCFLEQDSLAKAESHFDMALNAKPDYVDAMFMLGQIAERKGDIVEAKIQYQNALKLLPGNETITEALRSIQ